MMEVALVTGGFRVAAAVARPAFEMLKNKVERDIQHKKDQSQSITDAPKRIEELEKDTDYLINFLEAPRNNSSESMRALLGEVRNSIYDAEDAVDSLLMIPSTESKSKLAAIAQRLQSCCADVKLVRDRVEERIKDGILNFQSGEYQRVPIKPRYMVGFGDKERDLKKHLKQEQQRLDVIFVTGRHGIGKTTLAAKVFRDTEIKDLFGVPPIWVTVPNSTTKNIFLAILTQMYCLPKDASMISNEGLAQLVADCLKGKKFLIVMDGVSSIDDKQTLLSAFEQESDKNSKILITTASDEVVRVVGAHYDRVELPELGTTERWNLLKQRVFGEAECPYPELESYGQFIAEQCCVPREIEYVADILVEKDKQRYGLREKIKIWNEVSVSMGTYFKNDPTGRGNASIISNINGLNYNLRACLLYMVIFPDKTKFPVSKLIRMWVAEGFILADGDSSLEETAREYLEQLIEKNLVVVDHVKPDGSVKSCSMHYLLYDLCKSVAADKKENFLQEVKESKTEGFRPPVDQIRKYRRVCMHSDISKFINSLIASNEKGSLHLLYHLRSFVSHSVGMYDMKKEDIISLIRGALLLLRVLDAKPMGFTEIPGDLYLLVHLRYVTLSLSGAVLPADIYKLVKIQTLVVHTPSRSLKVEADILRMTELRHFKTNASATLPKITKSSTEGGRLQTLCGISPKSCTDSFFKKACNLKKLVIKGRLAPLLDGKTELLSTLDSVEKLKLINVVSSPTTIKRLTGAITRSKWRVQLCCLSQSSQFSPKLKSLTLSATRLGWDQISILGSPLQLEELRLKNDAFVGDKWEVSATNFPHLQVLQIECQDIREWVLSRNHFPELENLELSNCIKLEKLPLELASIRKLNKLHLSNCIGCTYSAEQIKDEKHKKGEKFVLVQ